MIRRPAFALIALIFAGCSVGRDFIPEPAAVPASFDAVNSGGEARSSIPGHDSPQEFGWWETFQDRTLSSLIIRASDSNMDLAVAGARIREARANLLSATGSLLPSIATSALYRHNRNAGTVVGGTVTSTTNGNNSGANGTGTATSSSSRSGGSTDLFQAGFDATWELDIFGGLRREREAAEATLEARQNDARDVFRTLSAEIAGNYFTLRGAQERLELAEKTLASQNHVVDIVRERYQVGFVSKLDLVNAEAQAASTASQIPPIRAQIQKLIYGLSVLLGRAPSELETELAPHGPLPALPNTVPIGLPSELARRRPDIRSAEAQLHAATAASGAAVADLFPKFSLTGTFGSKGERASDVSDLGNRFWSFGGGLNWPLFDGGRIAANIEVRSAQEEAALWQYRRSVLNALKDVENALTDFGFEQSHFIALQETVRLNRTSLKLAEQQYKDGTTDYLNVLTAERSLYSSEDALVQSKQNIATALVALFKALGGGWEAVALIPAE